jgi:hypothetical protein
MHPSYLIPKSRIRLGNNKPVLKRFQDLLKTPNLLKLAQFFIDSIDEKSLKTFLITTVQVLIIPACILKWLRHITMLFLSLFNKNKQHFLISKNLALAHSNSY